MLAPSLVVENLLARSCLLPFPSRRDNYRLFFRPAYFEYLLVPYPSFEALDMIESSGQNLRIKSCEFLSQIFAHTPTRHAQ